MLKLIVPVAIALFLVVSFVFLGGWPFVGDENRDAPPLQKNVETSRGEDTDEDATSDEEADGAEDPRPEQPPTPEKKQEVVQPKPPPRDLFAERLAALRNDPEKLARTLSGFVLDPAQPRAKRMAALEELRKTTVNLLAGRRPFSKLQTVRVQPGDNLTKIARRVKKERGNNVTPAFIKKASGLRSDLIRIKQPLRVPTATISVKILKGDFRLYVLLDDIVVLDYPIGIGKSDSTPEGAFTVRGKTKKPSWTMPDGRVVEYGHPEHIIGTRWMGFADSEGFGTGYGIHGTTEEDTIGKSASAGCIRMRRADVEEVFALVPEGASVEVLR